MRIRNQFKKNHFFNRNSVQKCLSIMKQGAINKSFIKCHTIQTKLQIAALRGEARLLSKYI